MNLLVMLSLFNLHSAPLRLPHHHGPALDPLAAELQHLPAASVCQGWIDWGERYLGWLDDYVAAGLTAPWSDDWASYRAEVSGRLECWRLLRRAHDRSYGLDYRRACLEELRFLLGAEYFFAGYLPPPVAATALFIIE